MNVASDILDNNFLFIKEGDLGPSASAFNSAKGNGHLSSQLLLDNANPNCLGVTLGDVGNIEEAGDIIFSILALLAAAPAVLMPSQTPGPHLMWGYHRLS
ncbi:hypothetical protein DSO57_1003402 [Entomophthora muscae]|uniref:Uncharacterized protein n=1 Tax=Entomophthora muscae TaxID=34485 RepID=A0ACC2TJM2_9FUNG|nr:hypothetical protein DSO57_1003402 [Entomophthora muscae]